MPYLWQFNVIEFKDKILVDGVVLQSKPKFKTQTRIQHLIYILSSYFYKPYSNKKLFLIYEDKSTEIKTDTYGRFHIILDSIVKLKPTYFKLYCSSAQVVKGIEVTHFPYSESKIDVITDIDDTLIQSHTASLLKRIRTLVFVKATKRKVIGYTKNLLLNCADNNARVHYISKSEGNLLKLITTIMDIHELPKGPMFLTNYLRWPQLFLQEKKKNFKWTSASVIFENSPNKNFILIGDDTQLDMQVYLDILTSYANRIKGVFIHKTKRTLSPQKKEMLIDLKDKFPALVYFNKDNNPTNDLINLNLDFAMKKK